MTKLLETFGTSVSFVAERKSYTASLALPKMLTLSKIGTSSILHSLNRSRCQGTGR